MNQYVGVTGEKTVPRRVITHDPGMSHCAASQPNGRHTARVAHCVAAFDPDVVQVTDITAKLSFMFGNNSNSLD